MRYLFSPEAFALSVLVALICFVSSIAEKSIYNVLAGIFLLMFSYIQFLGGMAMKDNKDKGKPV
jgi:hypothetical protein